MRRMSFPLAEAIRNTDIAPMSIALRAEPNQVAIQAGQLGKHDASPTCRSRRNLEAQQFFHREAVAEVIGKWGEVIDAIGER